MVSHESKFLEIDIITRKVTRTLDVRCDPKIIDCGIEKLYMVQGTLVSTTPDPMMGGGMANVGMTEDVRNRPHSSRMMICTNCN